MSRASRLVALGFKWANFRLKTLQQYCNTTRRLSTKVDLSPPPSRMEKGIKSKDFYSLLLLLGSIKASMLLKPKVWYQEKVAAGDGDSENQKDIASTKQPHKTPTGTSSQPHPAVEPECCMSGCAVCVLDQVDQQLDYFQEMEKRISSQKKNS